jgi:glutamate-ammonia-ligase adenylyltransferase
MEGCLAESIMVGLEAAGIMTADQGKGCVEYPGGASDNGWTSEVDDPAARSVQQPSRFMQRLVRRYADELALLPAGRTGPEALAKAHAGIEGRGFAPSAALRVLRQIAIARLAELDCWGGAPLEFVMRAMTDLAEYTLNVALRQALRELDALHGAPLGPLGQRAQLLVLGMGKLGARELNVSSDVDLVYVYDEDGETSGNADGRSRISCQEYFAKAVKLIYGLIGDATEHGIVFRVDLALRPNGKSGPPAISLAALEEYFQVQGREWERFAWLKSRVIAPVMGAAGQRAAVDQAGAALRAMVLPFVFRRYLDYSVFDSLRALHRQIRENAARLSLGRPERANDVKLSRGGIREIEFIVQLLQVVRGGQFPELRTRTTLEALLRVVRAGLMRPATADALARAYRFLRRVEHRIQYLDDRQTHQLPTADEDLLWIARTMGYPQYLPFLAELERHRDLVAQEFDTLLGGGAKAVGATGQGGGEDRDAPASGGADGSMLAEIEDLLPSLPERFRERVALWRTHPRVLAARDTARTRLARLVQRTAQWLAEGRVQEQAAIRLADWVEPLLRRESYLALLLERPQVHERLLRLLGAARWPARYLLRHPGVIDELANDSMVSERFDADEFEHELEHRLLALTRTGEDDEEALLDVLRRAHHAEVFRTLARDVEGRISVEQVADDLSALADSLLRVAARWCWLQLRNRHRDKPRFAIVGYGKLGGKELGYGSDLDIVFLFEDDDENSAEIYGAFVRKLINWLTAKTGEGDLYEIDTTLRPNGNSGLLVTTFEAFKSYQLGRGSNTAWTWEHQAITRARFVLGEPQLRERFDAVRRAVVTAPREAVALQGQITAMRERMRRARPVAPGLFDVKHSPGGMLDIEFAVQFLVLAHAAEHPELIDNAGNIALLLRAQAGGLLPEGVGEAASRAYRRLRQEQHRLRLDEAPTQVADTELAQERSAVVRLWQAVLG